jgi:hypothetical protein
MGQPVSLLSDGVNDSFFFVFNKHKLTRPVIVTKQTVPSTAHSASGFLVGANGQGHLVCFFFRFLEEGRRDLVLGVDQKGALTSGSLSEGVRKISLPAK